MMRLEKEDVLVVLRLLRSKGVGMRTLGRILQYCLAEGTSPASLAERSCQELQTALALPEASACAFLAEDAAIGELWDELAERSIHMLLRGWPGYPEHLDKARGDDAPPIVFATGNLDLLTGAAVGFCGSRKASERGLAITEECARSVAAHGLNVVSGYAHGVDLAAHRGALEAGGTTTLVLAEGILHFRLKRDIKSLANGSNFVAMSEFPPRLPWSGRNAMARNHTICGLSSAMILVESGAEGGTFECGKAALDQHCPLFVVDYAQRPDSAEGNAFFLQRGARALRRTRAGSPNLDAVIGATSGLASRNGRTRSFPDTPTSSSSASEVSDTMLYDRELLASLVHSPRESLDVELKGWIDPMTPEGTAKIARGSIALRNHNGGYLVIGIDDSGTPDPNVPADVRGQFHGDRIQEIVAKSASHRFEVAVEFVERDGILYPIICVPPGVETPVAAKSGLDAADRKQLIRPDTVYVRSLNSNNMVSTTAARWQDWDRLVTICSDNREGNVARFVRRHLTDLNVQRLAQLFQEVLNPKPPDPTPLERAGAYLDVGLKKLNQQCAQREIGIPQVGIREAAVHIAGEVPAHSANETFLNLLQASKPHHTGWTPWIDSQTGQDPRDRPYVSDGGWEALLVDLSNSLWGAHLDFWRIDPNGSFYCLRGYEDDLPNPRAQKPQPGKQLDFLLQISRAAEIISVALSFARAMGCKDDRTSLAFAFRWTGLLGRHLTSWVNPERTFFSRDESRQNVKVTQAMVPLDAPPSSIAAHVEAIVAPLFELFGGMRFETSVIEGIVRDTLSRRF